MRQELTDRGPSRPCTGCTTRASTSRSRAAGHRGACRCSSSRSRSARRSRRSTAGSSSSPTMEVVEQRIVPDELVAPDRRAPRVVRPQRLGLPGADWFVRDLDGPHVAHESRTVQFCAERRRELRRHGKRRRQDRRRERRPRRRGGRCRERRARRVRRPRVGRALAGLLRRRDAPTGEQGRRRQVPVGEVRSSRTEEIATIGDMPNDVLMFAHSGLSIAMGRRRPRGPARGATRHDHRTTRTALRHAVDRFILNR